MTIVFIKTEINEYLIPFAANELTYIKNGIVYKVEDFFKNMNQTFDENQIIKNPDVNSGLPYRTSGIKYSLMIKFSVMFILFIVSAIGLFKIIRNSIKV